MKTLITLLFPIFICSVSFSQSIVNGSFEDLSGNADLSGWTNLFCGSMQSATGGSPGGGSWHMQATAGNSQSCFPEYVFQKFPTITNGQLVTLSGWAYTAFVNYQIGIGIGKINNNTITQLISANTVSTTWTQLNLTATYNLGPGDTAIVFCYPGMTFGPGNNEGHFDNLSLNVVTGLNTNPGSSEATFYPNPCTDYVNVSVNSNAEIQLFNLLGQEVGNWLLNPGKNEIDVGHLPKGVYFIHLSDNGETIVKKLVKH